MKPIHLLWSGDWIAHADLPLFENRSFLFGDGFFETMRWSNPEYCLLWDFHWSRIQKSILALKFPWPTKWDKDHFFEFISSQLPQNQEKDLRVKLIFFRNGPGRYAPETSKIALWFEIEPVAQAWIQPIQTIKKAESVFISKNQFSWIKSTSALEYVMAGIERMNRKADDLVLCTAEGFVVEGSYSFIFWFQNGQLFLPDSNLGGLQSCMRKFLMHHWDENKISYSEVKSTWEEIQNADWIGFGCGTGLRFWLQTGNSIPFYMLPDFNL